MMRTWRTLYGVSSTNPPNHTMAEVSLELLEPHPFTLGAKLLGTTQMAGNRPQVL